jgi:cytidylate kinase
LPITDPQRVAALAEPLTIELTAAPEGARVVLDGKDVSEAVREPEISLYASAVSAIPEVRRRMVAEQRRMASARGGVMEGRDIGTKVFPETPFKFFLTATAEVRARRRCRELSDRGKPQSYESVLAEMDERDRADRSRADSPLIFDDRYQLVDTTSKPIDEVVAEIERRLGPRP